MSDTDLLQVIKRIAMETIKAGKPCDYVAGTVKTEKPLEIAISHSLTLDEEFLDLTRNVTDHDIAVTIEGKQQMITIHNDLKEGEKVWLLRKPKGQKYLIVDRMVSGT